MIDWLLAPIDASRAHDLGAAVSWHGRTMVLVWAVLIPAGVIAARYFKVTPAQNWPDVLDNPWWWHLHRRTQMLAGVLMLVGLALVLARPAMPASVTAGLWLHHWLGWSVLALALSQFTSALLRGTKGGPTSPAADGSLRGDHFDMTPRRRLFEYLHKFGGLLAVLLSVPALTTGLWQANAPVWMWLVLSLWWLWLALCVGVLEQRVSTLDTYQAIWGPDPALPGNQRRPIGFRVRRRTGV